MKLLSVLSFVLVLTGCRHPSSGAKVGSRPDAPLVEASRSSIQTAVEPLPFVKDMVPGDQLMAGKWEVKLAHDAQNLTVAKLTNSGRTTVGPQNWRASEGSFVCVESLERLWIYDGRADLTLFQADAGSLGTFGPRQFPCEIPQLVAVKLPAEVYDRVKPAARR